MQRQQRQLRHVQPRCPSFGPQCCHARTFLTCFSLQGNSFSLSQQLPVGARSSSKWAVMNTVGALPGDGRMLMEIRCDDDRTVHKPRPLLRHVVSLTRGCQSECSMKGQAFRPRLCAGKMNTGQRNSTIGPQTT